MTDRINGFFVTLDKDVRDDDVQSTVEAIKHIKGVLTVTPNIVNVEGHVAYERVRREIYMKILKELFPEIHDNT